MQHFQALSQQFEQHFGKPHFPLNPHTLYNPAQYILNLGGKRVRPVLVLLGNQLFDEISPDAYAVASAVELFHNFTLIHDDIMDAAQLRRGEPTVHHKFGSNTALLAGDVMLVKCYDYLSQVRPALLPSLLRLFNKTASEVCEGQQLDMDYEVRPEVSLDDYIEMIRLKTSVLLAAALQMGAMLGGAGLGNQEHLYSFGQNLGIAFQVQDDYLDTFGEGERVGKAVGGDIRQNKKTFLAIHTQQAANAEQKKELQTLSGETDLEFKVQQTTRIMKECKAPEKALALKKLYFENAMQHLEEVAVVKARKQPLFELAEFLISRDY